MFSGGTVFAQTLGAVGSATIPYTKSTWHIGLQALYLKPSYSDNLSWPAVPYNKTSSQTDHISSHIYSDSYVSNNPAWRWSFEMEASYHFHTDNDLNITWYHLGNRTTLRNVDSIFTITSNPPGTDTVVSQQLAIKPSWDAVNLEFSQHINFNEREQVHFHGGVQYAHIKNNASNVTTSTPIFDINGDYLYSEQLVISTTYNGFGPRIGADFSYQLGRSFVFFANGATALLTGTTTFTQSNNYQLSPPTNVDSRKSSRGSKRALVPELEGKLGVNYTYAMIKGKLTVDVGYMWVNYFNAQTALPAQTLGSDIDNSDITFSDSNFSVQGPYVGLKWLGNFG